MNQLFVVQSDELRTIVQTAVQESLAQFLPISSDNSKPETLLSRKETAEFLHISLPTLNARMRNGEIPYYNAGRRILFSRNEVVAAMKAQPKKGGRK